MAGKRLVWALAAAVPLVVAPMASSVTTGAQAPAAGDITFTRDIAPILQRSCQECHHPDGVAPMSLVTYDEVRPWARAMKTRTGAAQPARRHAAVLRREEHRHPAVQARSLADRRGDRQGRGWADSGAPRGNAGRHAAAARLRRQRQVDDRRAGSASCSRKTCSCPRSGPDWWGDVGPDPDRPDGGSLCVRGRGARGQRHSAGRRHDTRSAGATSSIT